MDVQTPDVQTLIDRLGLVPHPEGGYFREVYRSGAETMRSNGETDPRGALMRTDRQPPGRNVLTSIYWLLDERAPVGWFCRNASAHVHYFHAGAGITYHVIRPDGAQERHRLGADVTAGEVFQLVVEGGCWKAAELDRGGYCLIGEAVAPGFDFRDFAFGTRDELSRRFPALFAARPELWRLVKDAPDRDFARYYPPA
jgi:predicted cupin superfamily sugar epimerase